MIESVGTAVTLMNGAIATGKKVLAAGQAVDQAELRLQMADLMGKLAEAAAELAGAQVQITGLEREVSRLQDALETKANVRFCDDSYWAVDDEGLVTTGPYCSRCWETDKTLRRITNSSLGRGKKNCPECKREYQLRRGVQIGEQLPE